jgi:hypothetical protein
MPGHLLGVVTARWERNPQIPEPPQTPHLISSDRRPACVVVVGLAASAAASAPIDHAAPPAAGAKRTPETKVSDFQYYHNGRK